MLIPVEDVLCGLGAAVTLVSVPLMWRKVPMNHLYGVRLRKSFSSERNWYEINAYGGRLLAGFGLFLIVFSLLTRSYAPPATSPWAPVYLVAPLLVLLPVLARIAAFARTLPDRPAGTPDPTPTGRPR